MTNSGDEGADGGKSDKRRRHNTLDDSVGFYLGRAHDAILQSIGSQLSEIGLPPGRIAVMTLIAENPGITPRRLTELTRRDKSTLTPMLTDLERNGFIVRLRSKTDRRSYGLSLSEAGVEAAEAMQQVIRSHEEKIVALLGAEGREALLAQLKTLSSGLYTR